MAPPASTVARRTFPPNKVPAGAAEGKVPAASGPGGAKFVAEKARALGGRPTASVCERGRCELPDRRSDRCTALPAGARPGLLRSQSLRPMRAWPPRIGLGALAVDDDAVPGACQDQFAARRPACRRERRAAAGVVASMCPGPRSARTAGREPRPEPNALASQGGDRGRRGAAGVKGDALGRLSPRSAGACRGCDDCPPFEPNVPFAGLGPAARSVRKPTTTSGLEGPHQLLDRSCLVHRRRSRRAPQSPRPSPLASRGERAVRRFRDPEVGQRARPSSRLMRRRRGSA